MFRYQNNSHKLRKLAKSIEKMLPLERVAKGYPVNVIHGWSMRGNTGYKLAKVTGIKYEDTSNIPRMMIVNCENCGQQCSFSILEGVYLGTALTFAKANLEVMKWCPRLVMNSEMTGLPKGWHKAQEAKPKPLNKLTITKNRLGGYQVPLPGRLS